MASTATAYRREAREALEKLHGPQLRVARDFLTYLHLKEEGDPTLEVLANRRLVRDLRVAREDLRKGRREKFAPWKPKAHV